MKTVVMIGAFVVQPHCWFKESANSTSVRKRHCHRLKVNLQDDNTQKIGTQCVRVAVQLSCVLSSRRFKLSLRSICSSNSTRYIAGYCFDTVYHYSAMVDVLGK